MKTKNAYNQGGINVSNRILNHLDFKECDNEGYEALFDEDYLINEIN